MNKHANPPTFFPSVLPLPAAHRDTCRSFPLNCALVCFCSSMSSLHKMFNHALFFYFYLSTSTAPFPAVSDASAPPPSAPFNPHGCAFPSGPSVQLAQPSQPASQPSLFGRPSAAAAPSSTPSPATGSARSATSPSPFSAEASAARAAAAAAAGHSGGAFTRKDTRKLDAVRDGERLIKHALSAVVFSDIDTTVAKLREALQILQSFTTTSPQ